MFCQNCGVEAPTRHVAFYQNIGAVVVRFGKSVKGDLCKDCIQQIFTRFTLINLLLGWWGVISFILNPFLIINNLVRYIGALSLEPVPSTSIRPVLTESVVARLQPHTEAIFNRLNQGEPLEAVMSSIAYQAGVQPGEAFLYTQAVAQAASKQSK